MLSSEVFLQNYQRYVLCVCLFFDLGRWQNASSVSFSDTGPCDVHLFASILGAEFLKKPNNEASICLPPSRKNWHQVRTEGVVNSGIVGCFLATGPAWPGCHCRLFSD